MHSEFNPSDTEKVKFFQIWIKPNKMGIQQSYEQKSIPQNGVLTPLVTPTGENGSLSINQEASLSRLVLGAQETFEMTPERIGYMHVVKGAVNVNGILFNAGDAFASEPKQALEFEADSELEALWFDLPVAK